MYRRLTEAVDADDPPRWAYPCGGTFVHNKEADCRMHICRPTMHTYHAAIIFPNLQRVHTPTATPRGEKSPQ